MPSTARLVALVTALTLSSWARRSVGDSPPPLTAAAAAPAAAAGFALPDLRVRDRVGARIGVGYAELLGPDGAERSGFTLLVIEPFARFAVAPSLELYGSVPVTWTDGASSRSGGELANLTGGVLYAPGDLAAGAELSVNVGHAPAAHAALERFDLDHFADDTVGLRLHADVERRAGKLRLSGQLAVMVLASEAEIGTLLRIGGGAGLALPRGWTAVAEYLVLTDALDDRFAGDDYLQLLNVGARCTVGHGRGTVGLHVSLPLDPIGNEDGVGASVDVGGDF